MPGSFSFNCSQPPGLQGFGWRLAATAPWSFGSGPQSRDGLGGPAASAHGSAPGLLLWEATVSATSSFGGAAGAWPAPPPPWPPPPVPAAHGSEVLRSPRHFSSARHRASQRQSRSPASDTAPPGCRPAQLRAAPPPLTASAQHSSAVRARAGGGPRPPSTGTGTVVFPLCAPRVPRRWLLPGGCCHAIAPAASCCCCPVSCCPSPTPSTWTSKVPPSTPAPREVTSDSPWTSSSPARPLRKWPRSSPQAPPPPPHSPTQPIRTQPLAPGSSRPQTGLRSPSCGWPRSGRDETFVGMT